MTTQAEQIDNMINTLQEDLNSKLPKTPQAEEIDDQIASIQEDLDTHTRKPPQTESIDAQIKSIEDQINPKQEDEITLTIEKEKKFLKFLENERQKTILRILDLEKIKMEREIRKQVDEENLQAQLKRIDMNGMLEEESMKFAENHGKKLMKIFFDE